MPISPTGEALLFDFKRINVLRDGRRVLRNFSLQLRIGEHLAILGPNGSGKSTFIKTLTRELYPVPHTESHFEILGHSLWDVSELRRHLGLVSPDILYPLTRTVTVRELVLSGFFSSLGLWPHHRVTPAMERKTKSILRFLNITHLAQRPLQAMSSGEHRRALIGRALVHDPQALVLDEPTTSLDPKAIREFRQTLRHVAQAGTTVIVVTHDLHDIIPEIQRVMLLKNGTIFRDGKKAAILKPAILSTLFKSPLQLIFRRGYYHLI